MGKFYDFCHKRAKCSCWFDGWFGKDWSECCRIHDLQYMRQDLHDLTKQEVDLKLFRCVKHKGGLIMASLMYVGNKCFSWYYWNKYKGEE